VRVFVAGATGAIGRPLVPQLRAAGHDVIGMTRSQHKTTLLREAGAEPVVCDALDRDALRDAVVSARPEVVVHELTDIPDAIDPRKFEEQFETTDRLRSEGTRNLLDAALAAGARRIVAQSVAFAYEPGGELAKTEEEPLYLDSPPPFRRSVHTIQEMEQAVTGTGGIEGVVLRYGFFYGTGTAYAFDGSLGELVRARRMPIVGRGTGVYSFIHIDDAAGATALALERGAPGIYNVVDDEPALVAEWLPVYAEALRAKRPRRVPAFLARFAAGRYGVYLMTGVRGASNAKARRELGWEPRYPSWRQGFSEALG
jgi:nucleoside-diphosphate-sugar epimerase